ncbi:MAG: 4Fe-4S binding protein, partial [Deltaproteobacteria bacterium]|nr:4Fe-4S binding protein [Deltaproteobacteria bacterium]
MKVSRKIIRIDEELCDGCGQCVPSCAEGAIAIVDGKARVLSEKFCDGLGACLGECPQGALSIEERVAEEFDEKAVEIHLEKTENTSAAEETPMACGCPSSHIQILSRTGPCETASEPRRLEASGSELSHWPVQIRLVPPKAPFLKRAHLLVAADCTAVACPDFHREFLKGKAVMLGCPKFDDVETYVEKFRDIFREADIQSVTILDMEVPC